MANVAEPSVCRMCGRALPRQQGRGRVRRYCSARCRDRARRRRADSTYRDLSFVKNDLTATRRHEIIDGEGDMSGVRDPVAAKVAEAAQQLVDELDHPGSPDGAVAAARNLSAAAE